jgi:D-3-phosphoglycerate dehydrogenase / 2-oxoglutarate reductase
MPTPTPTPPPLIIITEPIPDEPARWIAERAEVLWAAPGEPAFESNIAKAAALVVRTYTRVECALLDRAPKLQAVARAGVGLDNIDLEACAARNIKVFNTPDANTAAVAEYVFALILSRLRPIENTPPTNTRGGGFQPPCTTPTPIITTTLDLPTWEAARTAATAPRELGQLTLGILGLGRIGTRVARIARAFEMRVLFTDLLELDTPPGIPGTPGTPACTQTDLPTVLTESDILTIHVDGRPENRNFIAETELARLKPNTLLINTSRGFIINEPALATWLTANPAAHALLDVHATEPITADSPLLPLPNASLYPHAAAATVAAKTRMGWVVRDLWAHLATCGAT